VSPVPMPTRFRFDAFELDSESGELRKSGRLLKLQPQPFRVLILLIEHAGQLVSREEIRRCLWKDATFVDFEHGINFSINQVRAALGDSAEKPRYVETLPRRGYRFVGSLEPQLLPKQSDAPALEQTASRKKRISRPAFVLAAAFVLASLILALLWNWRPWSAGKTAASNSKRAVAVIDIENHSQDPSLNWLGDGVVDLLTTDLAQARKLDVISSERVRNLIGREVKPGQACQRARCRTWPRRPVPTSSSAVES
jgi:DNA-binding winged helix-turn-helix (wHTH) protein